MGRSGLAMLEFPSVFHPTSVFQKIMADLQDIEQARFNMVEQQIRTWDVLDQEVLDLLYVVHREEFVPPIYRSLAFSDLEIPLGTSPGERMWAPKMEARVIQELKIGKTDRVLEVGTGSGYLSALLAQRAAKVYSVDVNPELVKLGKANLAGAGIENAIVECGDAARGWAINAPYDIVVLTGSVPVLPESLLEQLKPNGRLFAIVGDEPVMTAKIITRHAAGFLHEQELFETCTPALENAFQPSRFHF